MPREIDIRVNYTTTISFAGSMYRAEREKITSREQRRKKTSKSVTSIRIHKGLENRLANFLVGAERIFSFAGNAIMQFLSNSEIVKILKLKCLYEINKISLIY